MAGAVLRLLTAEAVADNEMGMPRGYVEVISE